MFEHLKCSSMHTIFLYTICMLKRKEGKKERKVWREGRKIVVLVFYCWVTNYHELWSSKQNKFIILLSTQRIMSRGLAGASVLCFTRLKIWKQDTKWSWDLISGSSPLPNSAGRNCLLLTRKQRSLLVSSHKGITLSY